MEHARALHGHADHGDAHDRAGDPHGHRVDWSAGNRRRLLLVMSVAGALMLLEALAGYLANSLALLSDAAHVGTDVAAIGLAYVAMRISMRPANERKTFGYQRAEIVAAFLNAVFLWGLSAWFIYEAWDRLRAPLSVDGQIVVVVGAVSLCLNVGMAWLLHAGSGHSHNVRSAYLHVLSDALGSTAAMVAGAGALWFGAYWLDAAATLLISVLIVVWTWRLTRDTLHILLEGTPAHLEPEKVRASITSVPGVMAVHDLHVWSITTGVDTLSAHVRVADATQGPAVVRAIRQRLADEYHVRHVTIEVETEESACVGCN